MKDNLKKKNKEFVNKILNNLYKFDKIISVTIVGSFIKNYNISNIGDLDVVVVCNKLSKNVFNNCCCSRIDASPDWEA